MVKEQSNTDKQIETADIKKEGEEITLEKNSECGVGELKK